MNINLFRYSLVLIAAWFSTAAIAQSSDDVLRDKITDAVMKVYDEHLAENPNDYNTLFARAHQQFYNGDYTAALADVNQAMLLTPKTDKELRFDEYILRARISEARQDYVGELADLRLAQELQPKSLACTDLIAKANLKTGDLNAAEKAFKTILRAESMNYDAMYGLAQVAIARGDKKGAIEQMDKAVALFRVEPQVYINRADIQARSGDIEAAVQDLVMGMSVGDGGNAAQALFELSDTNYDAVMLSLANIADKSADSGTYRYLRANIAIDHNRYGQALRDLNLIKRNNLYESPAVDYNIAKCCLELGRWDEAITHADNALQQSPNQPDCYVVKALALLHSSEEDNTDAAMDVLNLCSSFAPQYVPMLMTKALLLANKGDDNSALGYLNAAVANEPANAEARLTRALLLQRMDKTTLANKDYTIVSRLSDDAEDLKGIALSQMGRDTDALKWINTITGINMPGGENFYQAAVFMALRGDNYKAMEYAQRAIDNGFGSRYRLQYDNLSLLGLKSLRSEPGFDLLIDKGMRNFNESD